MCTSVYFVCTCLYVCILCIHNMYLSMYEYPVADPGGVSWFPWKPPFKPVKKQ